MNGQKIGIRIEPKIQYTMVSFTSTCISAAAVKAIGTISTVAVLLMNADTTPITTNSSSEASLEEPPVCSAMR